MFLCNLVFLSLSSKSHFLCFTVANFNQMSTHGNQYFQNALNSNQKLVTTSQKLSEVAVSRHFFVVAQPMRGSLFWGGDFSTILITPSNESFQITAHCNKKALTAMKELLKFEVWIFCVKSFFWHLQPTRLTLFYNG